MHSKFHKLIFAQVLFKVSSKPLKVAVAMPRCPLPVADTCPQLQKIKPHNSREFRIDLLAAKVESSRSVSESMGKLKMKQAKYEEVKRFMRAKGWVIHVPPPDNFLKKPCIPMWVSVEFRDVLRRMYRHDEGNSSD